MIHVTLRIMDPAGRYKVSDTAAWRAGVAIRDDCGAPVRADVRLLFCSGGRERELSVEPPADDSIRFLAVLRDRVGAAGGGKP